MKERLVNYMKAAYPAIAIQSSEESRVQGDVIAAAKEAKKKIYTWSASEGLCGIDNIDPKTQKPKPVAPKGDPLPAFEYRTPKDGDSHEEAVYIFRDVHLYPLGRDPILCRALKDLLVWAPTAGVTVVFIGVEFKPPAPVEKLVTVLDYALPDKEALRKIATLVAESCGKKDLQKQINDELLGALGGLSVSEADNALALSYVETREFQPSIIYREKVQAVRKTGLLEIIEADPKGLDNIGGLDTLKAWVTKRKRAYTPEAEKFGLPAPKGVLAVGVPGSGKSLVSKAIGTALNVPTLKLDIGSLFNSLVGESESRTRDALKLAEAMAPCVLWLDEIDKGLAGSSGSGSNDSGVTRRVFGTIITWMQERKRPVFLIATANDVTALPPELLRKGRFDEIFAVDLPTAEEREAIFKIHIEKKARKIKDFDLALLAENTEGFTGSEIEAVINDAMITAFDIGKDIDDLLIVQAAKATTPLSITASEKINGIREWAKTRARFASSQSENQATQPTVKTGRKLQ